MSEDHHKYMHLNVFSLERSIFLINYCVFKEKDD
jgi:hypothetical protein